MIIGMEARRTLSMTTAAALALALLGTALAPSRTAADVQQASQGDVEAQLDYNPDFAAAQRGELTITRGDEDPYVATVGRCTRFSCELPYAYRRNPLTVRDLDGDNRSEVVVEVNSGGAHCCVSAEIFAARDTAGWSRRYVSFDNGGFRLADVDHDGITEFLSADTRFAYEFASFAESFFPLRILSFQHGKVRVRTRAFKSRVRRDAGVLWRYYLRRRGSSRWNVRGTLAAYMADKYLLGEGRSGWRRLRKALRRGDLRAQPLFDGRDFWPSGTRYLRVLRKRLHTWGYS